MGDNEKTISCLNALVETCKDGEDGFKTAAGGVVRADLKTLFNAFSQQRAQFAAELQNEVRLIGGDPERTGSVAGSLHRGWIDIKSAVTGKDDNAILSECARGEDSAVKNYEGALADESLPAHLREIVQRQYVAVKDAHARVRSLARATGAGA
ncbi:MAG TPA: PA2169 family four-helix-bundle protein [Pyrinomonadaceae bacterium]|jgi:uncharacterized protein (TIGR02284 family)